MHRRQLLEKLRIYSTKYQEELEFKKKMIAFVEQNENCFERSLATGHITASCWLVNKNNTHALLMHHAKLDRWLQMGGHSDGNSNTLAVAIKEAQEESGIKSIIPISCEIFDIDIHGVPANAKEAAHDHYDVRFLLQAASDEKFVKNHESKELRWIAKDRKELPAESPSLVRMFEKWLAL